MNKKIRYITYALVSILLLAGISSTSITISYADDRPSSQDINVHWSRTFGGRYDDFANSVQHTNDGGYIIVGDTESYGENGVNVWLIKTDSNGYKEWSKTYGGKYDDHGYSVQQTNDSGYIISGSTFVAGHGTAMYLIKTDADGNEEWDQKILDKKVGNSFVCDKNNNGYIIAGSIYYNGYNACVMKTDANGYEEWNWTSKKSGHDVAYSIEHADGGYIITGYLTNEGNNDVHLIKLDLNGNEIWNRTFDGGDYERGYSVHQTNDKGFIIAGYTKSYGAGYEDVWLIKTDSNGYKEWSKTYGGSRFDIAKSVKQTNDGGYIITGTTYSYGHQTIYPDLWVIKADANGNEEWNMTLGGTLTDCGRSILQNSDGSYIIAGYTSSYGAGHRDVWLIKLDAGNPPDDLPDDPEPIINKDWEQTFGSPYMKEFGKSCQQTNDKGYIIAGYVYNTISGTSDIYIIKTNSNGNEDWSQIIDLGKNEFGESIDQTNDGGYIIAGYTAPNHGYSDVLLIKTDANGNKEWNRTFGGYYNERAYSVHQTNDKGYIIVGYKGVYDIWLIKTDSNGYEEWNRTLNERYDGEGYSVQQTRDNGYIVTGYYHSRFYLIKTDANGYEEWNRTFERGSGHSVQQTNDGGYIAVGHDYNKDVYVVKTDANGSKEWSKTFGGRNDEYGISIQQTIDGGYIIGGNKHITSCGCDIDIYIIKLNSDGNEEWSTTIDGGTIDKCHSIQQIDNHEYIIAGTKGSGLYQSYTCDIWLVKISAEYLKTPDRPYGKIKGKPGIVYKYVTTTTNFIGDKVFYKWDFGDEITDWIGEFNSGDDIIYSHIWTSPGTYYVKVKSKDSLHDVESKWSNPLKMVISDSKIAIIKINGGFRKISAEIINTGDVDIKNVIWNISVNGERRFSLINKKDSGNIKTLETDEIKTISIHRIRGIGKITVTIEATVDDMTVTKERSGFIFFFFVFLK